MRAPFFHSSGSYIDRDRLIFLYTYSYAFTRIFKSTGNTKLIRAGFSDFETNRVHPKGIENTARYVMWMFRVCGVNLYNFNFPKDFFKGKKPTNERDERNKIFFEIEHLARNNKKEALKLISFEFDPVEANEKTSQYLEQYLEKIINNTIIAPVHYKAFKKQKEEIIAKIKEKYHETEKDHILFELKEIKKPETINFIEVFLILEKEDYLKITRFDDETYDAVFFIIGNKLKEKFLKEDENDITSFSIESSQKPIPHQKEDNWYFELRCPDSMELILITNILDKNNLTSYLVGKPQIGSPANEFFEYLEINYFEKGKNKGTIKIGVKSELNLGVDIDTMLSNYEIKGYLKKIFFKISSQNKKNLFIINFDNCVTKKNLLPRHIEDIRKQVGKLKKLDIC